MRRQALAVALALAVASSAAGCSKRTIDPQQTGSVHIKGTSWYRLCDGRNAIFWVKGIGVGDPDEIEMVIYDHWACVPDPQPGSGNGLKTDPDGLAGND